MGTFQAFTEAGGVPGLYALAEHNPQRKQALRVETVVKLQADAGPEKKIADKDKWFPLPLKNSEQEAQIHISDCTRTAGTAAAAAAENSQCKERALGC